MVTMDKTVLIMGSVLYYCGLLLFTVIYFIPFSVLFFLTVLFDKERVALHVASRGWAKGIYKICPFWRVRVEGLEHIDQSKPYVIVTNHQSMLDVPLMYVLPLNFKWVSKKEVLKMPIFGWVLRMHGDIAIERGSGGSAKRMMHLCTERLRRGTSVIVFPEGTRTGTGRINRFKEGAFLMAKTAGAAVLPVVHDGNGSVLDGWKVRMPHTFTVRVLEPIPVEKVEQTDLHTLTAEVNALMTAEHRTMRPDLYEGENGR